MKVVNVCLAGSYNDGWGYQDNLLTKYQKKIGNDVTIITTRYINDKDSENYLQVEKGSYLNEYGIKVIRLDLLFKFKVFKYLRLYRGLYDSLCEENPEMIFVHCCQFMDIRNVYKYALKNPEVIVKVDNHADYTNSAKSLLAKIVHYTLWRYTARMINKVAKVFYGVMPSRVDFLNKYYGIPYSKMDVLVMGVDTELAKECLTYRDEYRNKHNCGDKFVMITGGKIDLHKRGVLNLMKAVKNRHNVVLFIFGSIVEELKENFGDLMCENIIYLGWIDQKEIYKYISASDLAVFPGRHSVVWEQCVGLGVPILVQKWIGTEHVNTGANCQLMDNDSVDTINTALDKIILDKNIYSKMKAGACGKGMKKFSYEEIAKKSVE